MGNQWNFILLYFINTLKIGKKKRKKKDEDFLHIIIIIIIKKKLLNKRTFDLEVGMLSPTHVVTFYEDSFRKLTSGPP